MSIRLVIGLVLSLTVVGGLAWGYKGLTDTISAQTSTISKLEKDKADLTASLATTKVSVANLKLGLERSKNTIVNLNSMYANVVEKLNAWKAAPPIIKYRDPKVREILVDRNVTDPNCAEVFKLIEKIGELDYEKDL